MGFFNILITHHVCRSCKNVVECPIQFKYGFVRQLTYHLGDRLEWGGNQEGDPSYKQVVAEAITEDCPRCGTNEDYLILIEDNQLVAAWPDLGTYDWGTTDHPYVVLDAGANPT